MRCHKTISLAVLLGAAVFQMQGCGDEDDDSSTGTAAAATPPPTPVPEKTLKVTASMEVSQADYDAMTETTATVQAANDNFAAGMAKALEIDTSKVTATSSLEASSRRLAAERRLAVTIEVTYEISGSTDEIAALETKVNDADFAAALATAVSEATGATVVVKELTAVVEEYVAPGTETAVTTGNSTRRLYEFLTESEQEKIAAVGRVDLLI